MRILIVEDEIKTAAYLRKELEERGFVVDVAPRKVTTACTSCKEVAKTNWDCKRTQGDRDAEKDYAFGSEWSQAISTAALSID